MSTRDPWRATRIRLTARLSLRRRILQALRDELPGLSCYEPSRLIGRPCSCVVGLTRAIEIVEGIR